MSKKITIKENSEFREKLLDWITALLKYLAIVLLSWLTAIVLIVVGLIPIINARMLITVANTFFGKNIPGGLVKK